MASSSTALYIVVDDDDDDGFDWDLAVKEIDASISTKPSSSNFASTSHSDHQIKKETHKHPFSSSKQSTLDKFIQNSTKNPNGLRENNQCEVENLEFHVEYGPSNIKIDPVAAKSWIFPVNCDRREYQFSIVQTALFMNTLVVLPTGLGKTFIAAVVMYNYFRWFPEGKIVFAAPSRPLVLQQVEALHKFVDIPQDCTIDLTGQTNPTRRASLWKEKRVFFVTPQVLEKDIHSGICFMKDLVCLVIDEAHRASGNYAYCVVVRQLMAAHAQIRILALTATPGSKPLVIQKVIDNLQISTLEYRNETHPDVLPYVHARKVEQITVPMGRDADEVANLLCEVIQPIYAQLSAYGLLKNKDHRTLSPHLVVESRAKFREAPPQSLHQAKFEEIDRLHGVLITLCHLHKLLSSHGIKSAFEMLEEKLQSKLFGRVMGRNEVLLRAKRLMQQVVSHGAPCPKLSKLLELMVDHFKMNDPKTSRVIIFSNYRQSVSDILRALRSLTEFVKATEFIGQSSGKASKGQSQKNQQAVLEKFRTGEYNVIVATSIGEEGLDIMEVDLVISFDANISPLRMIQRMGRTGRKHEGRVVVLAYQGKELTGYLAKKKTGNAINKHMKDGGMRKFSFHSSPRMIPHIFKPEVQFLKLSIPKYVPRGKSTKDVLPIQVPAFQNKLSDEEAILLAKYFEFTGQDSWRPSLIAFRHSQAFPSKVHRVMHSFRTGMLIDSMQHLQELCSPQDSEVSINEDENDQNLSIEVSASEPCERNKKGCCTEDAFKTEEAKDDFIHMESPSNKVTDISLRENSHAHLFLFGSEFLSVDGHGRVIVSSVSHLYLHETSNSKSSSTGRIFEKSILGTSRICDSDAQQPKVFDFCEKEFQSPDHKVTPEGKNIAEVQIAGTPDDDVDYNFGDIELSPRLTNLIKSGVVPESPIADGLFENKGLQLTDELVSTPKEPNEKTLGGGNTSGQNNEPSTPAERIDKSSLIIIEDNQTPVARLSSTSCSKDWYLGSSTEKSESAGRKHKFRRLLRLGDLPRRKPPHKQNSAEHSGNVRHINRREGEKRKPNNVGDFIEEEAEVSSEVSVSDDEDDKHEDNSSYDDSFIDDRINPTAAADSQPEASEIDMLAIYRRSLLTQSPMPDLSINYTPHSEVPSSSQADERSRSANGVQHNSAETKPACSLTENDCKLEGRKRKLSSYQTASLPVVNLQNEFSHHSKAAGEAVDPFDDDLFFQNIDLDAVEEEAARILRERSHNLMLNAPSFDLGI